ncbi:hypothetical protein K0M31_007705 [Melipona bicolor]|uniref:Uncharacterized protein n=1 Tax=Melipona bicolor TaxID=60889 RepID=A0AA40KW13_9HYME|nr:hypothetical protein K0M31_007705 [Melipona bicolor]
MEHEMIQIQKSWNKGQDQSKTDTRNVASQMSLESGHVSTQTNEMVEMKPREMQTDPYTCCLDKKETNESEVQTTFSERSSEDGMLEERMEEPTKERKEIEMRGEKEEATCSKEKAEEEEMVENKKDPMGRKCGERMEKEKGKTVESVKDVEKEGDDQEVSLLREQLSQALKLASERSSALIKFELQLAEHQAKVDSLNKVIESKALELTRKEKLIEEYKLLPRVQVSAGDCSEKLALKSTINSLQKLLGQKEETIARYQNLLKEDRDEHSNAAARLQEEIRGLRARILSMQSETRRSQPQRVDDERDEQPEKLIEKVGEIGSRVEDVDRVRNVVMRAEEVARLQEKVSTLEADLSITRELSDRWRRLAEERLKHMDRMRERYCCGRKGYDEVVNW